jgi:hypothetical protein
MPEFHDRRDGSVSRLPDDHQEAMRQLEDEIRNAGDRAESVLPVSETKKAKREESAVDFMARYEAEIKALSNKAEEIRPISEQKKDK